MFLRMMICIVVIAIAAPFFIPGPNGTPLFTLDMFALEKPSLPSFGSNSAENNSQTLYRYQDEQGVWHYTDQPLDQDSAEQIEVSTDINLIDAPPALPRSGSAPAANISANPLNAISRGAEVMEDAEQVQQMLDDRLEDMDQTLNSIQ